MKKKTLIALIIAVLTLAAGCSLTPGAPLTDSAAIFITYTPAFTLRPNASDIMMVDIEIENSGYRSFSIDPAYFSLLVNGRGYSPEIYASELETGDLTDGGRTKGRLIFQLPPETVRNITDLGMGYSGRLFNIVWENASPIDFTEIDSDDAAIPVIVIKYNPAEIFPETFGYLSVDIDLENTGYDDFDIKLRYFTMLAGGAVYHPRIGLSMPTGSTENGEVMGRIAFEVPSGFTEYNLLYSGPEVYNIKWVDMFK